MAIVVNDYTRPTPLHSVLPHLLDVLNRCGVYDSQIRVVVALGTHRPMSIEEFRGQAGEEVLRRVGFINPDIDDPDTLRLLGGSSPEGEVWVNRVYTEADFKIAIGTILPHGAVGFSGGAKLIYPGIAGRKTVESFHVTANADPENRTGRLESPVRGQIEKLVELVGLDLMINLVVNPDGAVCGLTAGHYIESHRRAVPLVRFRQRIQIGIVSPGLNARQVDRMGFRYFPTVEQGLEELRKEPSLQEQFVDLVTRGGATYPYVIVPRAEEL